MVLCTVVPWYWNAASLDMIHSLTQFSWCRSWYRATRQCVGHAQGMYWFQNALHGFFPAYQLSLILGWLFCHHMSTDNHRQLTSDGKQIEQTLMNIPLVFGHPNMVYEMAVLKTTSARVLSFSSCMRSWEAGLFAVMESTYSSTSSTVLGSSSLWRGHRDKVSATTSVFPGAYSACTL